MYILTQKPSNIYKESKNKNESIKKFYLKSYYKMFIQISFRKKNVTRRVY